MRENKRRRLWWRDYTHLPLAILFLKHRRQSHTNSENSLKVLRVSLNIRVKRLITKSSILEKSPRYLILLLTSLL